MRGDAILRLRRYRICSTLLVFSLSYWLLERVLHAASFSRTRSLKLSLNAWVTDFHAGPIGCQLSMFEEIGLNVTAKIDFPNCRFFKDSVGGDVCAEHNGLKVLALDNWRGFSLDQSNPIQTRKDFYRAYILDPEFQSMDIVFCSHPAANCELYLPFDKNIVIYNTQRIEFGRGDDYVWWRQPYLGNVSARWLHWSQNLQAISRSANNLIAANNMFDVKHMEYLTGVNVTYIPSWCGENIQSIKNQHYRPIRREIVLTPYRLNLEFYPEDIPKSGWPSVGNRKIARPLDHPLFDSLRREYPKFPLIDMSTAFSGGHFESVNDFRQFRAVLLIPYQASTMFFFQLYRTSVPILAPSQRLLHSWIRDFRVLWEVSYGNPPRVPGADMSSTPPNPNSFLADDRAEWFDFYDVYNNDTFPHILYFDSWASAVEILNHADLQAVSDHMRSHNIREYSRIRKLWEKHLLRISESKQKMRVKHSYSSSNDLQDVLASNSYPLMPESINSL